MASYLTENFPRVSEEEQGSMRGQLTIVGQGLAGTCLAWRVWSRGQNFRLLHLGEGRSTSVISAGLLTPVTGRNLNPSWRIAEFLDEALGFYREVEGALGEKVFHEIPILRLFANSEERQIFDRKNELLRPLTEAVLAEKDCPCEAPYGGVIWKGGGRLDTRRFLEASGVFFRDLGLIKTENFDPANALNVKQATVMCTGAAGLGGGPFDFLPERRAKGEILTVRIPGQSEDRVLSRNGWMVPLGQSLFRVGSTYSWNDLTDTVTSYGRSQLEKLAGSFTSLPFETVEHVAGVRPIIRQSRPVIGSHPENDNLLIFNGLGSKGVLYAPGVADRLAAYLCERREIEEDLNLGAFLG
ncbi:MAG: hypothetical protein CMN02_14280 [Roseibacillus sp.]|nr:hypothetical protein [Roseibacillus sp.]